MTSDTPVSHKVAGGCLGAFTFWLLGSIVGGFIIALLFGSMGADYQFIRGSSATFTLVAIGFGAWLGVRQAQKRFAKKTRMERRRR